MAQTSEQNLKESDQNNATAGPVGSTNALPVAATGATTTTATTIPTTSAGQHPEHEDKEYDPSAEALIDDIDDERTLEEEEAMAAENPAAVQNELDDLKRESEMPIEELLAYYQRMREQEGDEDDEVIEEDEDDDEEDDDEEDMEGEDDDEVSRRRKGANGVKTGSVQSETASHCNQTNQQLQQQQTSMSTLQANQSPVANNTNLLSPTKPSQPTNSKINQQPNTDLNELTSSVSTGDLLPQSHHQQQTPPAQQSFEQSNNLPPAVQEETISIESLDEAQQVTATTRQRHSMTEFLVGGDVDSIASGGIFKTLLDYDLDDSDDMDEDYSYTDDENVDDEREWRRVIHVGPEFQANVPDSLSQYENDLPPYENQDILVWKCSPEQTKEEVTEYLQQASTIPRRLDISICPASVPKISTDNMRIYRERMGSQSNESSIENPYDVYMSQSRKRIRIDSELEQENADHIVSNNPIRDENSNSVSQDSTRPEVSTLEYYHGEEQLLYLLLQCNHNFEEALRRRRLDPFKYYFAEPMSLWSQDECLGFEHGLRIYGKNFRLIRETKVPTRTRAETVAFYYLWKKSERHDVYTNQYKLDRKRSLSHPGTTDYMDKFIEDNETALNASSTPTPTPTESTVEINQISDIHHNHHHQNHNPLFQDPSMRATLQCATMPNVISRSSDDLIQKAGDDDDLQDNQQIYLDGNAAI